MLNIESVTYKYNQVETIANIDDVSIDVKAGECVVFCGRSGSGKTTLTKLINALIPNYYENGELNGCVLVNGIDTKNAEIYEVARVVSSVFQNPKTQFFNVNTTSEILFYLENRGYDRAYMHAKLLETAQYFGIDHLLDRDIFELSGGEKQIIAIAAAYVSGTDVVLLDEPSSNLDIEKTKLIGDILKKIKAAGKTIIISEHRFYYIKDIIDRVYYIDSGCVKCHFSKDAFFAIDEQKRKALGLRAIEFEALESKQSSPTDSAKALAIKKLYYPFSGQKRALDIQDISFNFGQIIGVYGSNGIGKSTFIRLLMGLQKSNSKILLGNQLSSSKKRLKNSYLVMQDVNHQLFTDSVETEVELGKAAHFSAEDVARVLKTLNIYDLREKHPMSLSGGQKQRVAIASAILSDARIICFDEPTSGMDYDNMMRIAQLIKQTIHSEIIIFIISHDHEFLNCTADQIFDITKFSKLV